MILCAPIGATRGVGGTRCAPSMITREPAGHIWPRSSPVILVGILALFRTKITGGSVYAEEGAGWLPTDL